jgi:hypothetical protein
MSDIRGIPIYDLRLGQCKFATTPFDAKLHLFCAEPVEYEGCPYCPEHAARCFNRSAASTPEEREAAAVKYALSKRSQARRQN